MGAGGAGGGRGQGAEDEEHKSKITVPGEDPESLFGGYDGDTKPTPPVIGA